jgi:hypothetical protein
LFSDLRVLDLATAVCAVGALVLGLALCSKAGGRIAPRGAQAGLTLAIAGWQAVGVLPQSFSFRDWTFRGLPAPTLDRYLLPLLPFAICLLLWAVRDLRFSMVIATAVVGAFALFAVAGTRDSLVYLNAIWRTAERANALGVDNTRLDAGAAWDGVHLYEYSRDNNIQVRSPGGAWWLYVFAPATDSSYVVAGDLLPNHVEVLRTEYSSWLQPEPVYLYLLRRDDVAGPP